MSYTYSGSDAFSDVMDSASESTKIVGGKISNELGLYDMSGNVWDWCWDWYDDNVGSGLDPQGVSSGSSRVRRGGSWHFNNRYPRIRYRSFDNPDYAYDSFGFRVCRGKVTE